MDIQVTLIDADGVPVRRGMMSQMAVANTTVIVFEDRTYVIDVHSFIRSGGTDVTFQSTRTSTVYNVPSFWGWPLTDREA